MHLLMCRKRCAHPLLIESAPATTQAGSTVYRFYIQLQNATDRVSAIFGNQDDPLTVTPEGAFNSTANTSWNASGINPVFVPTFLTLSTIFRDHWSRGPASLQASRAPLTPRLLEKRMWLPFSRRTGPQNSMSMTSSQFLVHLVGCQQRSARRRFAGARHASHHGRTHFRTTQLSNLCRR